MGVRIALDFFPAAVTLPSGAELRPVRVIVVNDEVHVYILQDGKPKLYFERPLLSSAGTTARGYDLQVADGSVRVTRDPGCGCGNPLRSFNPWPGERRHLVAL